MAVLQKIYFGRYKISPVIFNTIMNDDSYYKAIFVRDPLHRILSGILDKMPKRFHTNSTKLIDYIFKYIYNPKSKGLLDMNHHIVPQYVFCSVYKWLDKYKLYRFENSIERKRFLKNINLWENIGKDGWCPQQHNDEKNSWNFTKQPKQNCSITDFTNPQFKSHATGSINFLTKYFNVKNLNFMIEFYGLDYYIFKLPFKNWICHVSS